MVLDAVFIKADKGRRRTRVAAIQRAPALGCSKKASKHDSKTVKTPLTLQSPSCVTHSPIVSSPDKPTATLKWPVTQCRSSLTVIRPGTEPLTFTVAFPQLAQR